MTVTILFLYKTIPHTASFRLIDFCKIVEPSALPISALAGHSKTTVLASKKKPMHTANQTNLDRSLSAIYNIIIRVHNYVFGHVSYGDMRTLIERNHIWNSDIQKMLFNAVENCSYIIAAATTASNCVISIAGINQNSNDVTCEDHFRLTTCAFCTLWTTNLDNHWYSQSFWPHFQKHSGIWNFMCSAQE